MKLAKIWQSHGFKLAGFDDLRGILELIVNCFLNLLYW
jgi:hypothetical protein